MKKKNENQTNNVFNNIFSLRNIIIIIAVLFGISAICVTTKIITNRYNVDVETAKAIEYGQLEDNDYKTDSENVEFYAFVPKDINKDGIAEKTKGSYKPLWDKTGELYIGLNVNRSGHLEGGTISINSDNFNWSTKELENQFIQGNYVGNTSKIQLKNEIPSGSSLLIGGNIVKKIEHGLEDYSKECTIVLESTFVDEENNRTPIKVERKIKVEWFATINNSIREATISSIDTVGDKMVVNVKVATEQTAEDVVVKNNIVTLKAPESYGYKATDAMVSGGENYNVNFDKETGLLTIINENAVSGISYNNNYNVIFTYPVEAHGDNVNDNKLYMNLQIPVTSVYTGYEDISLKEITSNKDQKTASYTDNKGQEIITPHVFDVSIGETRYGKKGAYLSKEDMIAQYQNRDEEKECSYTTRWGCADNDNCGKTFVLKQTKPDELVGNNNYNNSNLVSYTGIYFGGNAGKIKVYDDETNELLLDLNQAGKYNENNPFKYNKPINKIRVEVDGVGKSDYGTAFTVYNIKTFNDEEVIKTINYKDFLNISSIRTYLHGEIKDVITSEFGAFATYQAPEANLSLYLSNNKISIDNTEIDETITIETKKQDSYEKGWKNGQFLIELPENFVNGEIEKVSINNDKVKIVGYDLYKENNKYYIRVLTSNEEEEVYQIKIDGKFNVNPLSTNNNYTAYLWGYNDNCYKYITETQDIHDVNLNENTNETVGLASTGIQVIVPNILLTNQVISNYDDENSVTIAPNMADVRKERITADININLLNNSDRTVKDVQILGNVPHENNTYMENDEKLGSELSVQMVDGGIKVPEELNGKVEIYYTENEKATKDLNIESNGWTKTPTDFSKVKRYLIDCKDVNFYNGRQYNFVYTVQIPENIDYHKVTYSNHILYYSKATQSEGVLEDLKTESAKVGIRIARKYKIEITKVNKENNKPVAGAVYKLTMLNNEDKEETSKIIVTNAEGKLKLKDLLVEKKYELEEIKNPDEYNLNPNKIKFIVTENNNKELEIKILSDTGFINTPIIEDNTLKAKIEDEPRYQISIIKKDKETGKTLADIRFIIAETGKLYTTNANGELIIKNLEVNKDYTLREVYADGYYLLEDIKFKVVKENNKFKIISENEKFSNVSVEVVDGEDLLKAKTIELENEKEPSIILNKIDKETGRPMPNVEFVIEGRNGKVYITDEKGQVEIKGLEENKEYTIKEIKADGYYLQTIKFTIVRGEDGELKINSQNKNFQDAVATNKQDKTLSVTLENEKIPVYNLQVLKVAEDDETKKLSGAKFTITSEDTKLVNEYVTNEEGIIDITNLCAFVEGKNITGVYTLQETEAPTGYCNMAEEIKFRVIKDAEGKYKIEVENQDELKTLSKAEMENNIAKLTIKDKALFTLNKKDSETKEPLKGVKFVIYEVDANNKVIDFAKDINGNYVGEREAEERYIVTTDENGQIALPLKDGRYIIMEVGYPEGYIEKDITQFFEVGENKQEEVQIDKVTKIYKIEDLMELAKQVNEGNNYERTTVKLMNPLDFNNDASYNDINNKDYGDVNEDGIIEGLKEELTKVDGKGFMPIGNDYQKVFFGTFDGQGNEISNIYIKRDSSDVGLFGYLNNATIVNLGISGEITGRNAGGIAYNTNDNYKSKIEGCYNKANVKAISGNAGGIISGGSTVIENCYNEGVITAQSNAGGIIGSGAATKCYNLGEVNGNCAGGIIGSCNYNNRIEYCYNRANIKGKNIGGGILGQTYQRPTISKCYNTGNIDFVSKSGKIIGDGINATVNKCYYLNKCTNTSNSTGISKTDEELKSNAIVRDLNKFVFKKDEENKNDGYPIIESQDLNTVERITEINTIEDFVELSYQTNNGVEYKDITISLNKTLDFNEDLSYNDSNSKEYGDLNNNGTIESIKTELTSVYGTGFTPINNIDGTFDGKGNEIRNIYIKSSENQVGLFKQCKNVVNLGITGNIIRDNANANTSSNVGAIAGTATYINNCYNKATITIKGAGIVGGIAGTGAKVTNSYNAGNINNQLSNSSISLVEGGIIGNGNAENCYNTANIVNYSTNNSSSTGGIIGRGNAYNCYNIANINASRIVGAITGYSYSNIVNCYYLEGITVSGNTKIEKGTPKDESYLKSKQFIYDLNKNSFTEDIESINNGYPIIKNSSSEKVETVEKIEDLVELSYQVNHGVDYSDTVVKLNKTIDFENAEDYRDVNDTTYLDLNGDGNIEGIKAELTNKDKKGFSPIGQENLSFKGTFDGQNNEIKNIYINSQEKNVGLFGIANKVINLGISGNIIGNAENSITGGIAGSVSEIYNSYNNATIKGNNAVGGIAEYVSKNIEKCYNTGNVEGPNAGGIVAYTDGAVTVFKCYNTGYIKGTTNVGGIAGQGRVNKCYNTGNVEGTTYVGGIAGNTKSIISNSYSIGNVKGTTSVGAIVGNGNVDNCYYLDSIEITGDQNENKGIAKDSNYMKTDDFVKELNKYSYKIESDKNNGYPILYDNEVEKVENINYIEDLLELNEQLNNDVDYTGVKVILNRTLDFNNRESYRTENDEEYNKIKDELTNTEGTGFKPIGNSENPFTGSFDGQNNEIQNIYIKNKNDYDRSALFGTIKNATIENLGITGNIIGYYASGIVDTSNESNINNCYNKADLSGNYGAAGIVNNFTNTNMNNCYNEGTISKNEGYGTSGQFGGIFVSGQGGTVKNCYNTADISVGNYIGGIGYSLSGTDTIISNCYNKGNLSSPEDVYADIAGIIVYYNDTKIDNCYNEGNIAGSSYSYIAGIAANGRGLISNCYNKGNLEINKAQSVGGITVGESNIENCYNLGDITVKERATNVGGISGTNSSNININNCYNKGNINVKSDYGTRVGGISSCGSVNNSYNTGTIIYEASDSNSNHINISGISEGNVTDSYNEGNIKVINAVYLELGGISRNGTANNCYNEGNITCETTKTSSGNMYVTGISHNNSNKCYNNGNIKVIGNGTLYVSGINYNGLATDCYNNGSIDVTGNGEYGYVYVGGISNNGDDKNCYNTGDILVNSKSNAYVAGISTQYGANKCYNTGNIEAILQKGGNVYGVCSSSCNDSYNSGNIKVKAYNNRTDVMGLSNSYTQNCKNSGNIDVELSNANYSQISGVSSSGCKESYNLGNINVNSINSTNVTVGKTVNRDYDGDTAYYYKDMEFNVVSDIDVTTYSKGTLVDSKEVETLESEEFYNVINQNNVWTHIKGLPPKLVLPIGKANIIEGTQINIDNDIEKFDITTDVKENNGVKGGTISGEDESPYEQVRYGESNAKEIVMTPDENYAIANVTVNGEKINYAVDNNGICTLQAGDLKDIKENKKVEVEFVKKEQILLIKKIDETTKEPLKGAKFSIITKDEQGRPQMYEDTTNEDGEIRLQISLDKTYTIQEKEAPEGYMLNPDPVTFKAEEGKDSILTITNKEKPQLIVHHYLKANNGEKTTTKVAEDEISKLDVNEAYKTKEVENLVNLTLEKDESGNYVRPDNAEGTMQEGGVEVTYYYETNPVEVKIHYYLDGTTTSIAPEETLTYRPQTNIENNKVTSVSLLENYNLSTNTNYQTLKDAYKLTFVNYNNKIINAPITEQNTVEITNSGEINYYYIEKNKDKISYTVEYYKDNEIQANDTQEESKIVLEEEEHTLEVDKTKINTTNKYEGYHFVKTEPETIPDKVNNGAVIKVYYEEDTEEISYTVEYYKDNEKQDADTQVTKATVTLTGEHKLTVDKTKINTTNKYEGYHFVKTNPAAIPDTVNNGNVIKVFYEKDAEKTKEIGYIVEYYKDNEKQDADTQVEKETVKESAKDTLTVDKTKINTTNKYEGYHFVKTDPTPIPDTVNNGNVIKVYYEKDAEKTKEISYTVEYYKDNEKQESDTQVEKETVKESAKDTLTVDKTKINTTDKYVGYHFVKTEPAAIPDTVNNGYVIKVYYEKDAEKTKEISYTVEYYKDNVKQESDTQVTKATVKESAENTLKVEKAKINTTDKYVGYHFVKTEPKTIPDTVNNGNVIKVYYEKDIEPAQLIVRYYDNVTNNLLEPETSYNKYVGDQYNTSAKEFEGYKLVEEKMPTNGKGTITKTLTVVNYYYVRKAKVIVRSIDPVTEKPIIPDETIEGHEGKEYETKPNKIEGYDLVKEKMPENAQGKMTKEDIIVTYYYKRQVEVEAKYIDKTSENEIANKVVIKGHEGDDYKTLRKDIKYYRFVEDTKNTEGKMKVEVIKNEDGTEKINNKIEVKYYYEPLRFNLNINKKIVEVIANGEKKQLKDGKLAKVEIHRKAIDTTTLEVKYLITVINDGELEGKAVLTENIPQGFEIKEGTSQEWKMENGVAMLQTEYIKPGESKEYEIVLKWKKGESNIGIKENIAELIKTENEANFQEADNEDNKDTATLIITVATGEQEMAQYIVATMSVSILMLVVIMIRRKNN